MSTTSKTLSTRLRYHQNAYDFVFSALRYTQEKLGRTVAFGPEDEDAHITGPELLEGLRRLALKQFGLMTRTVFRHWGIHSTDDFGRIVFELVERGEMRKTERDQLQDFFEVYAFEDVFDRCYQPDLSKAFGG
jgi:uncharacterized repeat protein (TIGR04138 family)